MSRPMMVGEKVYIRGKHDIQTLKYHINHAYLRIGLTNINPYEFGETEAQNIELEKVTCIQEQNNVILDEFVLGITLCPYRTCTLLIEKKMGILLHLSKGFDPFSLVACNRTLWNKIN